MGNRPSLLAELRCALMHFKAKPMRLDSPNFVRLFTDPISAGAAYEVLLKRGFGANEINIVMSEFTRNQYSQNLAACNGNLFKNGNIRCEWSTDEAEAWLIIDEQARSLESELTLGGILIYVYARNDDDEVYLENLWIEQANRLMVW